MPLPFKVTTAGRAALVNAGNTGTLPVTVTQVGVTATAFTAAADGSDLALPGELKRLATFGGAAVADDTIHAVIRDDSADVYTLRGFALYFADGTLFGLYGQADAILEKSAAAMMLLASDIIFADIDAASLVFGDTSFLNPPATVDTAGVVELATDAEAIAGIDGTRAVTPKGLLAKLNALLGAGAPSAFVKSLLTAIDLVAFRSALAIKTAASYDIGVGNGLDADLLDGQHGAYYRAWGNLTGVPGTFTPSAHPHSAADITSGLLAVARGGTGAGTFTAGSYLIGNGTSAFGVKTPAQVLDDIGAAASEHSHAIENVNGLPEALTACVHKSGAESVGGAKTFSDLLTAASGLSVNSIDPTLTQANQGFQFWWNRNAQGIGRNEYVNNYGSGTGGHYFYCRSVLTDELVEVMNIDRFGSITVPANMVASNMTAGSFRSPGANWIAGSNGAGTMYFRPNGSGSSAGQATISSNGNMSVSGTMTATDHINGSDERLKSDIQPIAPNDHLADMLELCTWLWLKGGRRGYGVIAQRAQKVCPHYVTTGENGMLGVDKAGIALEAVIGLAARVRALESRA
jgi:hypothetical protein